MRNFFLDNASWRSIILMMDLAEVLDNADSITPPRDHGYSVPVGWIRGHTKIGPVRQVKVTYHSEQFGTKIQVESIKNDGSLFWIGMSRGMNKCVEEVFGERKNLSITKRWQLVPTSANRSRQNKRDNQVLNHVRFTVVEWYSCRQWRCHRVFVLESLEDHDKDNTTSRSSSR